MLKAMIAVNTLVPTPTREKMGYKVCISVFNVERLGMRYHQIRAATDIQYRPGHIFLVECGTSKAPGL
jgi:hypothetical protein